MSISPHPQKKQWRKRLAEPFVKVVGDNHTQEGQRIQKKEQWTALLGAGKAWRLGHTLSPWVPSHLVPQWGTLFPWLLCKCCLVVFNFEESTCWLSRDFIPYSRTAQGGTTADTYGDLLHPGPCSGHSTRVDSVSILHSFENLGKHLLPFSPFLLMRKMEHTEVKSPAQNHPSGKGGSWIQLTLRSVN
jgi:hypothetical protein